MGVHNLIPVCKISEVKRTKVTSHRLKFLSWTVTPDAVQNCCTEGLVRKTIMVESNVTVHRLFVTKIV